jgi:hypothetical protein
VIGTPGGWKSACDRLTQVKVDEISGNSVRHSPNPDFFPNTVVT